MTDEARRILRAHGLVSAGPVELFGEQLKRVRGGLLPTHADADSTFNGETADTASGFRPNHAGGDLL
jgi:hypothetical protein